LNIATLQPKVFHSVPAGTLLKFAQYPGEHSPK
jgi:hypothetical protein